jgi:ATP-dependent protease HslVU (ClpYQ) peptidase subunit
MTAIVGIAEKGKVWIGGDSQATRGGTKLRLAEGKVAQNGEFLIGTCGPHRFLNLAKHIFEPPPLVADADLDAFMANEFSDAWRACVRQSGQLSVEDSLESYDGMILVGVRGCLYEVDSSFGTVRSLDCYAAIGSGDNIALGALHATKGMQPEKRIKLALEAAAKWDDGVSAPFTIKHA